MDVNVKDLHFTVGLSAFSILTPRIELVIPGVLYVYFVFYVKQLFSKIKFLQGNQNFENLIKKETFFLQ